MIKGVLIRIAACGIWYVIQLLRSELSVKRRTASEWCSWQRRLVLLNQTWRILIIVVSCCLLFVVVADVKEDVLGLGRWQKKKK